MKLTDQQQRVVDLVGEGKTNAQVAKILGISSGHVAVVLTQARKRGAAVPVRKMKGPRLTPDEIERMRAAIQSGVTEVRKVAEAMGRPYSGSVWSWMREFCGDLLPPAKTYGRYSALPDDPEPPPVPEPQEPAEERREARRPYDPVRDNPRMQRLLRGTQ